MKGAERNHEVVVARCGSLRLGVPLDAVRKVISAPLLTTLPDAPARVAGLANLHGTPLVVIDLSGRAERTGKPALDARILIVQTASRSCGLLCDMVEGTLYLPEEAWHALDDLVPGAGYIAGGRPGEDDLIVLRDPETWLSAQDEHDLARALERHLAASAAEAPA